MFAKGIGEFDRTPKHCGKKGSQAIKQISADWVASLPLYDPKVNEDCHADRIYERDMKLLELAKRSETMEL